MEGLAKFNNDIVHIVLSAMSILFNVVNLTSTLIDPNFKKPLQNRVVGWDIKFIFRKFYVVKLIKIIRVNWSKI